MEVGQGTNWGCSARGKKYVSIVKRYPIDVKQTLSVQLQNVQCISSTTCQGRKFARLVRKLELDL
jgi:hypothetical protein